MAANSDIRRTHPLLRAMAPEHRAVLLRGAAECAFPAGEILFREGYPANQLYLIHDGQVMLETHVAGRGDIPIVPVSGGHVLGWSWLMAPFVWNFQGRSSELTHATVLDGGHLLVASEQDHYLGYELMKSVSKAILEILAVAHHRWLETGHRPLSAPAPAPAPVFEQEGKLQESRIARQPFFTGFRPEHLESLQRLVTIRTFEAGERLFRAGTTAEGLHVIEQGSLVVEALAEGAAVPLHVLRAGDAAGWSSFWEPFEWQFDGRALEPLTTLYFKAADLRERCASDYHFAYELTKRITRMMLRHLQSTRNRIWEGFYSRPPL